MKKLLKDMMFTVVTVLVVMGICIGDYVLAIAPKQ